jgi:nucleoside 2-deoxyribosyltransferase
LNEAKAIQVRLYCLWGSQEVKIYLASSFSLLKEVEQLAGELARRGHELTCRWWTKSFHETNTVANGGFYGKATIRAVGLRNLMKIDQADLLIFLTSTTKLEKHTGGNIEVGYAFGKNKPVIIVGIIKESAMYSPAIHVDTVAELWPVLEEFER